MDYAIEHNRKVVTLVGKGNIQKFTEGAFVAWGFEVAKEEYGDRVITEDDLWTKFGGEIPDGKILVNYRITDAMFADIVARPNKYSVICTLNLNGDYVSDVVAALVGGLGIAPGGNIGDLAALFEATHGHLRSGPPARGDQDAQARTRRAQERRGRPAAADPGCDAHDHLRLCRSGDPAHG